MQEIDDICKDCPYDTMEYVEEIDGNICEYMLKYGDCYMGRLEEEEW